jgi:CHAT domain-containing protein
MVHRFWQRFWSEGFSRKRSTDRLPRRYAIRWRNPIGRALLLFSIGLIGILISPMVAARESATQHFLHNSASGPGLITPDASRSPVFAQATPAQLLEQGRGFYESGQVEAAIATLQQAITAYQQTGDRLNQALALRNLALAHQQLGQWREAQTAIDTSLALLNGLPETESRPVLARILDLQGHLALHQGRAEIALAHWQNAENLYAQLHQRDHLWRVQLAQSQALQTLGLYRRSIALLTPLSETLRTEPDSEIKAITLQLLGNALQVAGELETAKTSLQQALEVAQRLDLSTTLGAIQISLGHVWKAQGDLTQALTYYRAVAIATTAPLTVVQAQLSELSVLIDTQQWSQAETLVRQLQPRINTLPLSQEAIYAQLNWADNRLRLAQRQGRTAQLTSSAQSPRESRPSTSGRVSPDVPIYTRDTVDLVDRFIGGYSQPSIPNNPTEASGTYTRDTVNLVDVFLGGRGSATIAEPSGRTIPQDHYTRDNLDLAETFLGVPANQPAAIPPSFVGTPHSPSGTTANALPPAVNNATLADIAQQILVAQQAAKTLGDARSESYAWGALGHIYEQAQQWEDARTLSEKALILAQTLNAPEVAYRWQWQLGRILKAQSNQQNRANPDYRPAIAAYSAAVESLQLLRSDLVAINPEVQLAFQDSVEPVHRELVNLLLAKREATDQSSLEKARNIIESLQLAELDNFFREACLEGKPVLIDQVDQQAAVFYPIILGDRLEVILRLPGQPLQHYSTPVDALQVESTIEQLRASLVQKSSQRYLPLAQAAYDWLIRPVANDLANAQVKTLVFVSDGVLRNIPMTVLHDGQQFLVEHYAIALTPGLQLLAPNPLTRQNLSVLIAGLSEARQGFPALPNITPEIQAIETELPSDKILLNQAFTEANFAEAIRTLDAPIVHLATHGQFSSNLADTFVLTWNDRLSVNRLRELLQTTGLNQPNSGVVELLVLSACETAVGDQQAALGLAGTAVRSGARSTLGSLWQVSDEATALLISEFYKILANGQVTKAEALRQAQLTILKDPRFREHPFFWAPYIMVGNWL